MRSPRLALLTLTGMLADSPMLRVALVAILLVPLLYGALYLWAFWDPYGKLDQVPVAVVNLDKPVIVDGEEQHAGADIVKKLLDGKDVGWQVVSAQEASAGLKSRRFYLSLTIPSDFSANLATAKSAHPKRAELLVVAQESSNMLASQIMSRVFGEVRAAAAESASKKYLDKMFIGFSDAHKGLTDAALGASDLEDGLRIARAGARTLAAGAATADNGAATLSSGLLTLCGGLDTADAGATQISTGTAALADGLETACTGAASLDAGASRLASGAASADAGASQVASGNASLALGLGSAKLGAAGVAAGASQIASGGAALTGGLASLSAGASTLATSAAQLSAGAAQLQAGVGDALAEVSQATTGALQVEAGSAGVSQLLHAYVAAHPEAATDALFAQALGTADAVSGGAKQLADGLVSQEPSGVALAQGAAQVADGASQLAAGAQQVAGGAAYAYGGSVQLTAGAQALALGASQLSGGVASAEYGATVLAAGSARLSAGTSSLAAGASQVAGGASQLAAGTVSAASGARKLADGSATLAGGTHKLVDGAGDAYAGSTTLSSGLSELDSGAHALASGLTPAVVGAKDLKTGLRSGAKDVPNYSKSTRDLNTEMMSNAVNLTTTRSGEVPTYGTGFTPYFVPLALWVGALLTFFLLKPISGRALAAGANPIVATLGGFLPAAVIGVLQAIILMAVVQFGLGLKPVNVAATYGFAILTSVVFIAILQMLNGAFGAVGKLISIVLLMLQLTSAGGTFPTQMIPTFFQRINPWLPMSYAVIAMRQTVSGGDMATVVSAAWMVALFGVLALAITMLAAWRKQSWTMESLHPSLQL